MSADVPVFDWSGGRGGPMAADQAGEFTACPPRPVCACHGAGACVHWDNYRDDPGGRDPDHGWNWHCIYRREGCEGYSRILVVRGEWLALEQEVPRGSA